MVYPPELGCDWSFAKSNLDSCPSCRSGYYSLCRKQEPRDGLVLLYSPPNFWECRQNLTYRVLFCRQSIHLAGSECAPKCFPTWSKSATFKHFASETLQETI